MSCFLLFVIIYIFSVQKAQKSLSNNPKNQPFTLFHRLFTKLEKQRTKVGEEIENIKIDHEQARKDYEAKFAQDQIMIGGMEKKAGGKMRGRQGDSKVNRGGGRSRGRGGNSKSQNFRSKPHVDGKF